MYKRESDDMQSQAEGFGELVSSYSKEIHKSLAVGPLDGPISTWLVGMQSLKKISTI